MRRPTLFALLLIPALAVAARPCVGQQDSVPAARADSLRAAGQDPASAVPRKSGAVATTIALFTGGGGHIYAGEYVRGTLIMASAGLAFGYGFADGRCKRPSTDPRTCESDKNASLAAASMLTAFAIYGFGMWDAHKAVQRTNERRRRAALGAAGLDPAPRLLVTPAAHGGVNVGLRFALD